MQSGALERRFFFDGTVCPRLGLKVKILRTRHYATNARRPGDSQRRLNWRMS
jgi:hypothetical protein